MHCLKKPRLLAVACALAVGALLPHVAQAQDIIKIGFSLPLSGAGALWGKGSEWLCKKAAQEIKDTGGVKVKDKAYNFECISYDNKYTAAEATKVAQTLLNRDGVKFIHVLGSAPLLATQALTERQGAMLFNNTWSFSSKGPKFPLTFSVVNSPFELMPVMVQYLTKAHPQAKNIALLNANDATGREVEAIARPLWEKAGVKVVGSDFYERGTTEFQPIAARLMSLKPDLIDLSSAPPADAGQIFKELDVLGYKGIKATANGAGVDGLVTTGGTAVNGVYMVAAVPLDGPEASDYQRKTNADARAQLGAGLGTPHLGAYDTVYMLKAGMEKAQSIEPKEVAAATPSARFKSFFGTEVSFGGKEIYGSVQQPLLPVNVTQIVDGKLVLRSRVDFKQN